MEGATCGMTMIRHRSGWLHRLYILRTGDAERGDVSLVKKGRTIAEAVFGETMPAALSCSDSVSPAVTLCSMTSERPWRAPAAWAGMRKRGGGGVCLST